ncbi:hypothetical protein CONPUDRAFT_168482 [Coniophora puteana RWD-64-598 SS2]|uniref:Uncharacterized protein n=1 Tax=Coniophora puteana (strain RWD-64-598) TaxID=741705 RepID=A0A5M3MDE3_CONPW|nr:uncharacterized protein CONPUDRAFT_168482 [Coniophora puteana RWD-64-598 SS2]EIW76661.1 hypothetical protein CONPUDRAFT_168482 [Coniophora puteana RWD-64-598 SS2]
MLASPRYPSAQELAGYDFLLSTAASPIHAPSLDIRGRQTQYVESTAQRRERIEFLKKREWARRVAEWIRETSAQQDVMAFGCSGTLARSRSNSLEDLRCITPSPKLAPPVHADEEPYVIYSSSSPSSSVSSLSEDLSPIYSTGGNVSPRLAASPPPGRHHRKRSSASLRGPHRRPSLSSICEEPEED